VRAAQCIGNSLARLVGGLLARFRPAARTQARLAELDEVLARRTIERLVIRVGADELHALHAAADHVLDRIASRATHADHLDDRTARFRLENFKRHDAALLVDCEPRNGNHGPRSNSVLRLTLHAHHTRSILAALLRSCFLCKRGRSL
jgi:hypothetical protein